MAKSTRSKVKRAFRAKKRETGAYAAAEAARLHRLNVKLTRTIAPDEQDGTPVEETEKDDERMAGWWRFSVFGLLDPSDITPEIMHAFMEIGHPHSH
ncbi:hypothetical protein AX17_001155 [Amanita inopinata Kibby_2008]|nr:hypothetical protein AX17_001155 [Amanita inopinata Kibby_2008]